MRTFFAFRHMGRVLCVTDQVPWSHSSGGAVHSLGGVREYFLGLRRRMDGLALGFDAAGLLAVGAVYALLGTIEEELMGEGSTVLNSMFPAGGEAVMLAEELGIGSAILLRSLPFRAFKYILTVGLIKRMGARYNLRNVED